MARPVGTEKKLSIEEIEKLASIGATQHEIASFLGVANSTLEARLQRPEFREAFDRGLANLKLSLRRKQVLLADQGNVTMLIWLGKQLLNQKDMSRTELSNPDGSPVFGELTLRDFMRKLPEDGV